MLEKLRRFMYGRYGVDKLGRMTSLVALGLIVISWFIWHPFIKLPFVLVAYLFLGISIFRMLSRNTVLRLRENRIYMNISSKIKAFFKRDRKYYKYFACPKCKKTLKVPKHKGKISITCPHCRYEFIKKT